MMRYSGSPMIGESRVINKIQTTCKRVLFVLWVMSFAVHIIAMIRRKTKNNPANFKINHVPLLSMRYQISRNDLFMIVPTPSVMMLAIKK
jgi:hypothetical protein